MSDREMRPQRVQRCSLSSEGSTFRHALQSFIRRSHQTFTFKIRAQRLYPHGCRVRRSPRSSSRPVSGACIHSRASTGTTTSEQEGIQGRDPRLVQTDHRYPGWLIRASQSTQRQIRPWTHRRSCFSMDRCLQLEQICDVIG